MYYYKIYFFFILSYIFLIFFWYFLSSFGAVYQNTQVYITNNTIISFSISLFYPFFINVIPSAIRIYSLSDKHRKTIYDINKFFQLI